MKRHNIISISIVLACFLACSFFAKAATPGATATQKQFYLIPLVYDSANNTISLDNSQPISLTTTNLVKDTGSGSQFYAAALNTQFKYLLFPNKSYKYFLGRWNLSNSQKQEKIIVTVPYLPTAINIGIFDAKTSKVILKLNIAKFAKPGASAPSAQTKAATTKTPAAGLQTYQLAGHSAAYWWMMRGIIILILGGIGYFIYWFRKKRKTAGAINIINIPQKR